MDQSAEKPLISFCPGGVFIKHNQRTNNDMGRKPFEKGNKVGNRFTSENQPPNRGRKPKVYKYLKKVVGDAVGHELEEQDFKNIMQALIELPPSKLQALVRSTEIDPNTGKPKPNKDTPAWIQMLVSNINACIRYGKLDALEYVLDRVYGQATQNIEGTIENQVVKAPTDLSMLSTEELLQYNQLLEKIEKGKGG